MTVEPGGPLERDAPALPSESSGEPRTGSGASAGTPDPAQGESAALRDELATIIAHPKMPAAERRFMDADACSRCTGALEVADAVLADGFRRVVEDDDTIERLAEAMWFGPPQWSARIVQLEYAPTWRAKARAVVRALREDT